MHLTNVSAAGIRSAVDQMYAVGGFDMLIFSFGSGFDLENTTDSYMDDMKKSIAYANAHGIEVGGYDLISDTRSGTGYDAINPDGTHQGSACLRRAGPRPSQTKRRFMNATGLSMSRLMDRTPATRAQQRPRPSQRR